MATANIALLFKPTTKDAKPFFLGKPLVILLGSEASQAFRLISLTV